MRRVLVRGRRLSFFVALWIVLAIAGAESAEVSLEIALSSRDAPDFDANPRIRGPAGRIALFTAEMIIRADISAAYGIQGWSWSLSHEGVDLLSISTEGGVTADTAHGGLLDSASGFIVYEAIDPRKNGMRDGVVQAVVLSLVGPETLPGGPNVTGRHVYRATVRDPGRVAIVRYLDGLRGTGQPIPNVLTIEGKSYSPALGAREILIGEGGEFREKSCFDGIDDDGDGRADCDDEDCHAWPPCSFEDCGDGIDNDSDGLVDCLDPQCERKIPCPGSESWKNDLDDDRDGLVDCYDPDCEDFPTCFGSEHCSDGFDNDRDGFVDCADPECRGNVFCGFVESCVNGEDDDRDGLVDCDDPDCRGNPRCPEPEVCDDGFDNDRDGKVDCDDSECRGVGPCPAPEVCRDQIDNDGDGLTDCDDPECERSVWCVDPEDCDDGVDNDKDGLRDCADPDCRGILPCPGPERCGDGIDNDQDGLLDCDDPDCIQRFCERPEDCGDGKDNDLDLHTDCDDPECFGVGACPPQERCDDGKDDNGDGRVDCDDPDCRTSPLCTGGAAGFDYVLYAGGAIEETDRYVLEVDPGHEPAVEVTTWIVPFPGPQPRGVQGWSLSVAHEKRVLEFDPGGEPTTALTDADAFFSGGFGMTEVARASGTGGAREAPGRAAGDEDEEDYGFVSAVVLSLMHPATLDPTRPQSVARARYRVREDASAVSGPVLVRFRDNLRVSGHPVPNLMTIDGRSVVPLHMIPLELRPPPGLSQFVRGDANGDAKVNIADAVWCVNELIRRGPPSPCPAAADFNGDGFQDLSDAVYLVYWQFRSGPPIPPPYPKCGFDWRPSALECPAGSVPYCP